jgi:glycosyltransferase involved in cell wall biosynthesis
MSACSVVHVGGLTRFLNNHNGVATWWETLWSALDLDRVEVAGLAVTDADQADGDAVDRLRRLGPVTCGLTFPSVSRKVDVLVTFAVRDLGRYLPDRGARPLVVTVSQGSCRWTERNLLAAWPDTDLFVAVSKAALRAVPPPARDRCHVIHNAVPAERVRPTIPRERQLDRWGLGRRRKVLGFLGRVAHEKNPEALIHALAYLPDDWSVVYVGPDYSEGVLRAVADREAPGQVVLAGVTDDVGSALQGFDILCVPSDTEGCSHTVIEGWLAGRPVICTPAGVVPEFPYLWRMVPFRPTGSQIARAVIADCSDQRGTFQRLLFARAVAEELFTVARFGADWTRFLHWAVRGTVAC